MVSYERQRDALVSTTPGQKIKRIINKIKNSRWKTDFRADKTQQKPITSGLVVENPPTNARVTGSIPGQGRFHTPRGN